MKPTFPFLFGSLLVAASLRAAEVPVRLDSLVAEIAAQNPERKFYEAEIAAAKSAARTAGTRADPEVSAQLGHKRVRDAAGTFAGEGTAWSVSISQTFEWPGRLALRRALADRDVALATLGLARFESALAARARTLAFGLAAAEEKAAAAHEVAERFAALKEVFLARDPAGLTPLLDTRVIEAQELALQRRASESQLALTAALTELNQLRGAAPDAPLAVAATHPRFTAAPALDALLAAARDNNFEFRAKKLALEQQGFAVQLARSEQRPSFTVAPFVSRENADSRDTIVGLGVSVPLPVTGRARGATDTAVARRRQAEAAVLVAQREVERDVAVTAAAFAVKTAEAARWAPDTVKKFREAAALADRHYRLGAVPLATYVELQKGYLEAVESLLDTEAEALAAGLRLQQLTGLDFHAVEIAP